MKTHFRNLSIILFVFILSASTFSTVHASPQFDDSVPATPNPAAEAYLLNALRTEGNADLSGFPDGERGISGYTLTSILKDPQVQEKSIIYIANLSVVDTVYLGDISLPSNIFLNGIEFLADFDFNSSLLQDVTIYNSTFQGNVNLSRATFNGTVDMQNNTFLGLVDFRLSTFNRNLIVYKNVMESLTFVRSTINGNVDLSNNTINGGLDLTTVHITGQLVLDNTQILGLESATGSTYPVEFWTLTVDGPSSFVNMVVSGDADFSESNFYNLDMWGVTFGGDAWFNETMVERSADFSEAQFQQTAGFTDFYVDNSVKFKKAHFDGEAWFANAIIGRDIAFDDAVFNKIAGFDYITIGRFCDFIGTTFNGEFSLIYSNVAWPYFDNVNFNGPVNFEGMQASQDFEITDSRYSNLEQSFPVTVVTVDGSVLFTNFDAPAGLLLSQSQFDSLIISSEKEIKTEFIDISDTDIENELTINNINMNTFAATGAAIGKSTNLNKVGITKKLDMRNANIGFLKIDEQPNWPTDPAAFNLRGMTYTDIDIGDHGLTDETFYSLLGLVNQSAYSPQAYEALSQFLSDKGRSDWASEVELAQSRRERNQILRPFSGAWLWSWFLDIFAGYGKRPVFAFGWSALVIAIGAFVFRRKEDMIPVEQDDAPAEYNPIWYSFALFLPYVDLGIAGKWEPNLERKWARNYKYVHMILGWVLAPIALLTFSGIIG